MHSLTFLLDSLLVTSGLSSEEMHPYDDTLVTWYQQLAKSSDSKISNSANYMMVSRFIRKEDYDTAQEILNLMPDREDMFSSMADKQMLQVTICQHQGRTEEAAKDLQKALLMTLNKLQMLLYKLVDAELLSGEMQSAKSIADKASQMAELFDLWEYNSFVAPLQIAGAKKNAGECVSILRKLLASMLKPWDMGASPLFRRIAKTSNPKQMLPAILSEPENDSAYGFLQNYQEFKELISEYKGYI